MSPAQQILGDTQPPVSPNLSKVLNAVIHIDGQHAVTVERNMAEQSFLHQNVQKILFNAMNYESQF